MLLTDRNAVIYGGAGTIGGAVAKAFAREGGRRLLCRAHQTATVLNTSCGASVD